MNHIKQFKVRAFQVTTGFTFCFFIYTLSHTWSENIVNIAQTDVTNQVTILFTKWSGDREIWGWKEANVVCSEKCTFTTDLTKWNESSVVVFHGNNLALLDHISNTTKRPNQDQIWVWINLEPPTLYKLKPPYKSKLKFNWTMTYRKDSDIVTPYSRIFELNAIPKRMEILKNTYVKEYNPPELPSLAGFNNRKMAAWIVSNCKAPSKREMLVAELQKHVSVDIYGSCGDHNCTVPRKQSGKGSECHAEISKKYKFYLAFENSLCIDYVTEKFYEILTLEMIPIVYGSADYSSILPFEAYINVLDFHSLSDLANHMNYLSQNPQAWLQYFKWRKDYWVLKSTFLPSICDICDKLLLEIESRNGRLLHKSYANIHQWWLNNPVTNLSVCKSELEVQSLIQNISGSTTT